MREQVELAILGQGRTAVRRVVMRREGFSVGAMGLLRRGVPRQTGLQSNPVPQAMPATLRCK